MSEVNMNEEVSVIVEDATVITIPIDDTLTISGDAADAKAVGDALALKADASQVMGITVNGQSADNQGAIIVDGTEIAMSSTDNTTLYDAIEDAAGRTGTTIPINETPGAASIESELGDVTQEVETLAGDTVRISEQTLTDAQKTQIQENIGLDVKTFQFNDSDATCVWKVGRICFLTCISSVWYNDAANGNIRITSASGTKWTLPPECYPINNVTVKEPNYDNRITITTTGAINCAANINGVNLRFSACWITAV